MVLIMSRKKVFLLLISLVFMSLFSGFAFASNHEGGGLTSAFETIRNLFGAIPDTLSLEKLTGTSPDAAALFWARFLIWLLLFAAIYFGATKVFKDNKRIAVIVAIAISLMGSLLIPANIVTDIFQTYGLAAGFMVWFIPVIAGLFLAHKINNPVVKTAFYLILILLLVNIDKSLTQPGSWLDGNNWVDYFRLLYVAVIIAFFWNLFSMFGGGGGVSGAISDRIGGIGDSFSNWISGKEDKGDGKRGDRSEKAEKKKEEDEEKELKLEEEKELKEEMKATAAELNLIKDIYDKIKVEREELIRIKDHGSGDWADEVNKYDRNLTNIYDELGDVEKLNAKIRKHVENILKLERLRGVKGISARKRISERRDIAQRIKTQLDTNKFIDNMVIDAMGKINSTKPLGNMFSQLRTHFNTTTPPVASVAPYPPVNTIVPNPYTTYPPPNALFTLPAVEFNVLQQVLDEMKRVHALAAELYKSERGLGVRIHDIS